MLRATLSLLLTAAAPLAALPAKPGALPAKLRFSWDTLPQFFHSQNASGPWSAAALAVIGKYPLATFEKCHNGCSATGAPIEQRNTAACKAVNAASGGSTATVYYLNSVIDYSMFRPLADMLNANPEYRLRDPAEKSRYPCVGHDGRVQPLRRRDSRRVDRRLHRAAHSWVRQRYS